MKGMELAKNVGLKIETCKSLSSQLECPLTGLEEMLRDKNFHGIFVTWQIQQVSWGKFDGEKLLLKDNLSPNVDDWLECRIFNEREEIHLKRDGETLRGRHIRDEGGEDISYVDSFARLWGECSKSADGWITLVDAPRKISMELPCDDGGKKFYGFTTRNYIDSDEATGLSGYVDYRFVAIESAEDGD